MRRPASIFLWFLLFFMILPFSLCVAQVHKDTTYGYRITPPRNWLLSSRDTGSPWIIGEFISKKSVYISDPAGWSWQFQPKMTVIAFVHEVIKGSKVKTDKDDDGNMIIALRDPYKDYKDYLGRSYRGGGFFFSAEEESSVKGVPVTCYEVKIEKLARSGPRRIIAWVFHMEELDIAIQYEMLEKSGAKQMAVIMRSVKSFRVIDREGRLPTGAADSSSIVSRVDWDELTLEERTKRRLDLEIEAHAKALEDLPKGWKHSKVGRILVLSNIDKSRARKIAIHCQAIMKWLDDNLGFIGPDEYVRAPILKAFKVENRGSFSFSSGGFNNIIIEYEHDPTWSELSFNLISRRVMELWFNDRDRELYWALPRWVDSSLDDMFLNARSKGKRLEFPQDTYDRVRLKQAHSKGILSTPKDLMLMGTEKFYSDRIIRNQASALVRYFLVGPGSKSKKTKKVFWNYLKNLADVTEEIKIEAKQSGPEEKPTTEEEEDEYFKRRQNSWKDKERRVLDDVFERTFADWDEKDWRALDAAFKRMVDD